MTEKNAKVLRAVAITLMGLVAVFTLLGAVGTYCLAFNPEMFAKGDPKYYPYTQAKQWYQTLIYIKVVVSLFGFFVTFKLLRGAKWAYAGSLAAIILGLLTAATQMLISSRIREMPFLKVAPTNMRFFVTSAVLIFFLVIRFPGIWNKIGLGGTQLGDGSKKAAGGLALFVGGVVSLATPLWAGPTHMFQGANLVYVVGVPLFVISTLMIVSGLGLLVATGLQGRKAASEQTVHQESKS